jgi:hypothetical protein
MLQLAADGFFSKGMNLRSPLAEAGLLGFQGPLRQKARTASGWRSLRLKLRTTDRAPCRRTAT